MRWAEGVRLDTVQVEAQPAQRFTYAPIDAGYEAVGPAAMEVYGPNAYPRRSRIDSGAARRETKRSMLDMNGDGIPDHVFILGSSSQWEVQYAKKYPDAGYGLKQTWAGGSGWIRNENLDCDYGTTCALTDTFDIDGDGIPDDIDANQIPWQVRLGYAPTETQPGGFDPSIINWTAPSRWTQRTNASAVIQETADFNGDGLPDLIVFDQPNAVWRVYPNQGRGFSLTAIEFPAPQRRGGLNLPIRQVASTWDDLNVGFADFNGDGLPDLLRRIDTVYEGLVYPECGSFIDSPLRYDCMEVFWNNGKGFDEEIGIIPIPRGPIAQSYDPPGGVSVTVRDIVDINGDGLPDYVYRRYNWAIEDYEPGWYVLLNTGGNLEPLTVGIGLAYGGDGTGFAYGYAGRRWEGGDGWLRETTDNGETKKDLFDVDGDGLLDVVSSDGVSPWSVQRQKTDAKPHLMTMMENGMGGTNSIRYSPSTAFDNTGGDGAPDLPFVTWTVTGTRLNDGLCAPPGGSEIDVFDPQDNPCIDGGHEIIHHFHYMDGRLVVEHSASAITEREFRGFRSVWKSDIDGNFSVVEYSQGDVTKGRMVRATSNAYAGGFSVITVAEESNIWVSRSTGAPGAGRSQIYLGLNKVSRFDKDPVEVQVKHTFNMNVDVYGNVLQVGEFGANGAGWVDAYTELATPTGAGGFWVYDRPKRAYTKDHYAAAGAPPLEEKKFYYDGLALGSVGKGNLTKTVSRISDSESAEVTMQYDSLGNMTSMTDAMAHLTKMSYEDGTGLSFAPVSITRCLTAACGSGEPHESISLLDYKTGNPVLEAGPAVGQWIGFLPDNAVVYQYDEAGRRTCEVRPGDSLASCTVKSSYEFRRGPAQLSFVRVEQKFEDGRPPRTATSYFDALGRQRRVETLRVLNGALGPAVAVVEQQVEFDAAGRVAARYLPYPGPAGAPSNGAVTFDYHLNGSGFLDPLGRVYRTTSAASPPTTVTTRYRGTVLESTDEEGLVTTVRTDAFGRVVKQATLSAGGGEYASSESRYDPLGRLIQTKQNGVVLKTIVYDALGRKVFLLDADAGGSAYPGLWEYGYDRNGNLIYQDDPITGAPGQGGQHIQYCYDKLDRVTHECFLDQDHDPADPSARIECALTNPCGASAGAHYSYDNPSVPHSMGRLTRVEDLAGALRVLDYDARGRQVSVEREIDTGSGAVSSAVFSYGYNKADELAATIYPDGEHVLVSFNDAGQPVGLANDVGDTYASGVRYDVFGRTTRVTHGNGVSDTREHYGAGTADAQRLKAVKSGAFLDLDSFSYNDRGQITSMGDFRHSPSSPLSNGGSYQYDAYGRLTQLATGHSPPRGYAHDPWGNVTAKEGATFAYNPAKPHQMTAAPYDASGNRTANRAGDRSYAFDHHGRLETVEVGSSTIRFLRDYRGEQRAKIELSGHVTRTYNDAVQVLHGGVTLKSYFLGGMRVAQREVDDASWQYAALRGGGPVRVAAEWSGRPALVVSLAAPAQWGAGIACLGLTLALVAAPGRRRLAMGVQTRRGRVIGLTILFTAATTAWPIALRPAAAQAPSTLRHLHYDHLGSLQVVTGQQGQLVEEIRYHPYGEVRGRWNGAGAPLPAPSPDQVRFEFTGHKSEYSAQLIDAGARYYDPDTASFLTHDPAAQFANPYTYGAGDPVNGTDPTGAWWWLPYLAVALWAASTAASAIQTAVSGGAAEDVAGALVVGGIGGLGSLVIGPVITSVAAGLTASQQAVLYGALIANGAYSVAQGVANGQYVAAGIGAVTLAFGLYGLASRFSQGGNGGLSQQEQLNLSAEQFGLRFSTPLQRAGGYVWNMLRGDVLDLAGGVYGTLRGIGQGLYNIGAGLATLDPTRIGQGVYDLVSPVVPRLGSHGGLNYPGTPDNSSPFPSTGTKPNNASIVHDLDVGQTGFLHSAPHFRWIANAWAGPGVEPGIYGQAYRLVGTAGFGTAGGVLRVFGR